MLGNCFMCLRKGILGESCLCSSNNEYIASEVRDNFEDHPMANFEAPRYVKVCCPDGKTFINPEYISGDSSELLATVEYGNHPYVLRSDGWIATVLWSSCMNENYPFCPSDWFYIADSDSDLSSCLMPWYLDELNKMRGGLTSDEGIPNFISLFDVDDPIRYFE